MNEEHRELAVITNAVYGLSEGYICLTFEVHMASGYCSTLRIGETEASELIKDAKVRDIHNLNLMVCWVDVKNDCAHYDGMFEPDLWKR